ncbi:PREDICTED: zinc finger protein 527-like [Atta colombica]|uniref:zinc finger protein 527-like n=1 Tax=Atta colombica TaxID=520822 RepID=UPI00084C82A0|nr:PREDICTED: zinc finger protein 527-like [Atta colombica]XP_018058745.1 PREDICTED: zinc finger protein 527-like [Atta colombica]
MIICEEGLSFCTLAAIPPGNTRSYVLHSYPSSMMTTATTTMRTIKIKDVAKKKFPCTKCNSAFSRKGGLTYHQRNECGQEPRFSCPYCVYRAGHVSNARRHVKKCHPGQLVYAIDLGKLQKRDP